MKEFGWTEAQADAVLQTIAATAGDKIDLFSDTKKLKSMATGMYKSAAGKSKEKYSNALEALNDPKKIKAIKDMYASTAGNIKDRYTASIDKGKIVVNQASLMLANGEMIADDLGKKIVDSSKKLGEQTMQGTSAVVSTISTAVTNNQTTNNSAVTGGGPGTSEGRSYFENLVYTGNYR